MAATITATPETSDDFICIKIPGPGPVYGDYATATTIGYLPRSVFERFTRRRNLRGNTCFLNKRVSIPAARQIYDWILANADCVDDHAVAPLPLPPPTVCAQSEEAWGVNLPEPTFEDGVRLYHADLEFQLRRELRGNLLRNELLKYIRGAALSFEDFALLVDYFRNAVDRSMLGDAIHATRKHWEAGKRAPKKYKGVPDWEMIVRYARHAGVEGLEG